MDFRVVFAILLLSVATVKAKGDVSFWGEYVTMTCPDIGKWFIAGNITELADKEYQMKYTGSQDVYYCEYKDDGGTNIKYYFYIQGKACATCFEVDGLLFLVVIVVDLLGTIGLMFLIYSCTKKRSSAGPANTSKSPARSGGRGPPVPSPDYEQLNNLTRSQDTYSVVNRTG